MGPSFQVLIVEDDLGTRTLFRAVLQRHGLEITTAVDGEEALELLAERRFDAVVLDLFLQGTDGAAVLRHLRARWPEMLQRVVVATAGSAAYLQRIPELAEVATVLRKPLDIEELEKAVVACAANVTERQLSNASADQRLAN